MGSIVGASLAFRGSAPEFVRVRLQVRLAWMACVYVPSAVALAVFARDVWWAWAIWAGALAARCTGLALIGRRTRAFGYAETENELVLRRGLMFRSLEVIPYGRLQKVTVDSGPFLRRAGLADISLVTASSRSGRSSMPGRT